MSTPTPIEIVRAYLEYRATGEYMPYTALEFNAALASVVDGAERFQTLESKCRAQHWATEYGHRRTTFTVGGPRSDTLAELADKLKGTG